MKAEFNHLQRDDSIYISPFASVPEDFEKKRLVQGLPIKIHDDAKIGEDTYIGENTVIGKNVVIGPNVTVGNNVLILDNAEVCPNPLSRRRSSNAREIGYFSIIGPDVVLDDEIELGYFSIVPTADTVKTIGKFGNKNRTVTIYGSAKGPKISIGCNIGVDFEKIEENVNASSHTTHESANTYAPYLQIFKEVGDTVQEAFNDNEKNAINLILTANELLRTDWYKKYKEFYH